MINIEKGLSPYVLYYWFNDNGSPIWLTKDSILSLKNKLDTQFKKYRIKKLLSIGLISFALLSTIIVFTIFCITLYNKVSKEDYTHITGIIKLIVMIAVNVLIFTLATNVRTTDNQLLYRLKRFKYMYGEYFDLDKYWPKIEGCDAGDFDNNKLSILELMGRIESGG